MANSNHSTGKRSGTNGRAKSFGSRRAFPTPVELARLAGLGPAYEETPFKTTLYRYFGALADRKWLMAAIVLAAVIGSAAFAFTRTPVYVSSAVLRIEANPQQAVGLSNLFDSFAYFSIFYQTHLELLKSGNLPAKSQDPITPDQQGKPGGWTAPGFPTGNPNGDTAGSAEIAASNPKQKPSFTKMSVGGEEQTRLIRLQMSSNDPFAAREELRKYIEDYIERDRVQRVQLAKGIASGLRKEFEEAESRLRKSQQELLDFSMRHNVIGLRNSPTPNVAFFDAARDNFINSQTERWRLESEQKELRKVLPGTKSDAVLQDLKAKAASMRSEYESLGYFYGPRNLQRELLKTKAQSLEKAVAEIEGNSLSASLGAARNKETLAREAYDKAKLDAMNTDSLGLKYQILKKSVEADGQLYLRAMRQMREAELYDAMMDEAIAVESSPTLPLEPVAPNKPRIIGIGTLVSLICAIGLALFLGQFDRTLKSADEVRLRLSLPVLGVVPRISAAPHRGDAPCEPGMEAPELSPYRWPTSPLADSLRIVLNAVATQLDLDSQSVISVSSALPREGKTFVSVALAAAVASEGKAVLVIDGDLRNPRIHTIFGCKLPVVGVTDFLAGKCAGLLEAIHETPIPGLYYLPSGPMPSNPVSVLKSPSTHNLIRTCKRTFDMVLIDTPPILGLADATVLMGYSDGLILVAKQGHTSLDAIQAARDEVTRGHGRLLGLALNMAERRIGHYDYYHTEQYARYHEKPLLDDPVTKTRT